MYQTLSFKEFKKNYIINLIKISILSFFSIMIISSFIPFYEASSDSYLYGLKSISIVEGKSWEVTNEYLEETGDWVYVPNSWKKTVHDTAIPKYLPGFPAIGSIFYLIGGIYGLFYLGPILGILLLIISERIATNFFGKYVGLLTLIFLATNGIIWVGSKYLLSDNVFAIFTIVGFFFLIKFIHLKKFNYLIISSLLFSFSGFIRFNGIINFPIEIILVGLVLTYELFTKKPVSLKLNEESSVKFNFNSRNLVKLSLSLILPWLIFFVFLFSFNNYYFGDPTTTVYNIPSDPQISFGTGSYLSILEFKTENFELIKQYSNFVLPYPIYKIETLDFEKIQIERDDPLTSSLLIMFSELTKQNNFGIITFLIMGFSIFLSYLLKTKTSIIVIFTIIISINIIFWSGGHLSFGRDSVFGRYLIPMFPLFSIVFSCLIINLLKIKSNELEMKRQFIIKTLKIFTVMGVCLLITVAFYNSAPAQLLNNDEFSFTDPFIAANYYPLDKEGLKEKSIILGGDSSWSLDYGFNYFDLQKGSPRQRMLEVFNPDLLDQSGFKKLESIVLDEKNEVFVFKKLASKHEKTLRQALTENYGFVLKEYSNSFCSVELNKNPNDKKSDDICYGK